jgi:uncharacterized protein (TIGR02996 family)
MSADNRQRLLQRIHDDLDDDLARSVYADSLLELEERDAWHGELIRLQLDGGDPARIAELLRKHETRSLGPLIRLFDVTWVHGFPEQLRTRSWGEEHVPRLLESPHLPTIRSISISFMRTVDLPALIAAPEIARRVVTLVTEGPSPRAFAALLAASEVFPNVRRLGFRLDPDRLPQAGLLTTSLPALFESGFGARVSHFQQAILPGHLEDWIAEFQSSSAQQVDLLEVNESGTPRHATSFVRDAPGQLVLSPDPVASQAALILFDGIPYDFYDSTNAWPNAQLLALADRLSAGGLVREAETVREVVTDRPADMLAPEDVE